MMGMKLIVSARVKGQSGDGGRVVGRDVCQGWLMQLQAGIPEAQGSLKGMLHHGKPSSHTTWR